MSKGRQVAPDKNGLVHFHVSGGYGANTRQPFVEVHLGDLTTQMAPADARALALNLLSAAEAALSDGFLVEFMTRKVGIAPEMAVALLSEFRTYRTKEDPWGTPSA